MNEPIDPRLTDDAPPPFLGTWSHIYALVLLFLFVLICLLYFISRSFLP